MWQLQMDEHIFVHFFKSTDAGSGKASNEPNAAVDR